MLTDQTTSSEVIIACTPGAVPAAKRDRWMATGQRVYGAVLQVQELPDGYTCQLPDDPAMLLLAAEYVGLDRLCCTFLRWTLQIEPNGGPLWLQLTGGEGVKEYLRSAFETTTLLNESVAKAAGFSILSRKELNSVESAIEATRRINARVVQAADAKESLQSG